MYDALDEVDFARLFGDGVVSEEAFSAWHRESVALLGRRTFSVGWAAKLINVYLKTRVYVGGDGPRGLSALVHPPIDAGLWKGLAALPYYGEIRGLLHPREGANTVTTINGITRYGTYAKIIEGCRAVARREKCLLIEVEQFWLADPRSRASG